MTLLVGSGVTGAEFASGYLEAGVPVTLVSSRDRVLPGEDALQIFLDRLPATIELSFLAMVLATAT